MRGEFQRLGYDTGRSCTPIVPLVIGGAMETLRLWRSLLDEGVYTNVALPPAVPEGRCLLRTSYMATHTEEQLGEVVAAVARVSSAGTILGWTSADEEGK